MPTASTSSTFIVGNTKSQYDSDVNDDNDDEKLKERRARHAARQKARRDADREKAREASKAWYAANPGRAAEYMRRTREKSDDGRREYQREWHRANRHRSREYGLKTKYGITSAQWDALFALQGSRCGICGGTSATSKLGWSTDHCHAGGGVRGILCGPCNTMLGRVGDSAPAASATLERILEYLATCTGRAAAAAAAPAEWTDLRRAGAGRRFRKRTAFSPAFVTTFASQAAAP